MPKIRCACGAGMPIPLSATSKRQPAPSRAADTVTTGCTPAATNLAPLAIRFASSCSNSRGRASDDGQLADLERGTGRGGRRQPAHAARRRRRARARGQSAHARVREQILDQRVHALAAVAGQREQLRRVRRQRGAVAALEQRQEAGHRGQRLAQVVRDDRREALQLGVGALELQRAPDGAGPLARELLERLVQVGDVGARQVDQRLRAVGDRRADPQPAWCRRGGGPAPRSAGSRRAACARAARRRRSPSRGRRDAGTRRTGARRAPRASSPSSAPRPR